MAGTQKLRDYLLAASNSLIHGDSVSQLILNLAETASKLSMRISDGGIHEDLAAGESSNVQGEIQKRLDVVADREFLGAARASSVAFFLSEENEEISELDLKGSLALALDPLDGSSNISVNAAIGTIFSVLPAIAGDAKATFNQPGNKQLAAGYVIYGAQTQLVLTLGDGTHGFTLDRTTGEFVNTGNMQIAADTAEFAFNVSNYRHWLAGYRNYVDDCLEGETGPLAKNYNMRWLAALVGEAHRILARGGIFMYPADRRKNYEQGRLRLNYECKPIAFLIEQAGGVATDGQTRILDIHSVSAHQRSGLCFGAAHEMKKLQDYLENGTESESPLFGTRGFFRNRA